MLVSVNKFWLAIFGTVFILLSAIIGYFIYQNQILLKQLVGPSPPPTPASTQQSPLVLPTPSASPSSKLTLSKVQENIEAAVNSKNFAALTTFMTQPKVNFSLMSTECCEPQAPDEAVAQLNYINEGIPLDFNQQQGLIKNLKSKNSQLADTFIGVSKTKEHLAAFTLDDQGRISGIQLSVSWKLYNY